MNRKILVADPDPIQLSIVDRELTEAGYEVYTANSGEEALEEYARVEPALTILEINLPDKLGTLICHQMKTDPDLPGGLVLLVSAGIQEVTSVADASLRYHADFYLQKPFQVAHLVWKTQELMEGRRVGRLEPGGIPLPDDGSPAFTTDATLASQAGDLGDLDPVTLLLSYYLHRRSGTLMLVDEDKVRQVVFQQGFPVAADSNVHGEEYGRLAVIHGTCEGGGMVRARGAWQNIDRHLGVVAVSMGMMGARDHFRTMRLHLERVLAGAAVMQSGQYFLEYGGVPDHYDGIALMQLPPFHLVKAVQDGWSDERCLELLGEWVTMVASDTAHFIIRELEDVPYHENVLGMFVKATCVGDLAAQGRIARDSGLLQTIVGLRACGALWVTGEIEPLRTVQPIAREVDLGFGRKAAAEPAPPDPATRPSPGASKEATIGRVQPKRVAVRGRPAREKATRNVQRVTGKARPVHGQPRRVSRKELKATSGRASAEEQFERGAEAFGQGDYRRAIAAFDKAITAQPGRATYHVFLAQSILLLDARDSTMLVRAVESLKRAIQVNPRKGDPYHLLGVALVELKRDSEAVFALRKALQLGTSHSKETKRILAEIRARAKG
jgi:CheY-like chemotaxis protein